MDGSGQAGGHQGARPRRRGCARAAAALLAALLGAGGVELACRLAGDPNGPARAGRYQADEVLNHVFTPDHQEVLRVHPDVPPYEFRTNGLGLRVDQEDYAATKPAGTFRVLVCGDSFVEGYQADRTIPSRLRRRLGPLAETRGQRLEVINAGVGSYSPMLHYFALRERLLALAPDLVVLALDQTDARDDFVNYRPLLRLAPDGTPLGVRSRLAARKEALRQAMATQLPWHRDGAWLARTASWSALSRRLFEQRALGYLERYRGLRLELAAHDVTGLASWHFDARDARTREEVAYSLTWVERVIDLLAERHVPLVLAVYPHLTRVLHPELGDTYAGHAALAARRGVPFHDATPTFRAHPEPGRLFLAEDMHYDYAGQEVWASSLGQFLEPLLERLLP